MTHPKFDAAAMSLPLWVATAFLAIAVLHTFLVSRLKSFGNRFPEGSTAENLFHLLGEVEVAFGFWAGGFVLSLALADGSEDAVAYLRSRDFTEPSFVFVIMAACSTKPVLEFARGLMGAVASGLTRLLRLPSAVAAYASTMVIGPLLGAFITEPAAMTVTSLVLIGQLFTRTRSVRLKYATLGLLFVSVSIGGTLTPYAAPPILMVAKTWNWDLAFMLTQFGWKAVLTIVLGTGAIMFLFRRDFSELGSEDPFARTGRSTPAWVVITHLVFIGLMVVSHKHLEVFMGIFCFFLGLVTVTKEYQEELRLRESLLVAFFLGGIVVLGAPQSWWLEPLLSGLSDASLYLGAIGLTSITDNAALTYLAAQIPTLPEAARTTVAAGAVIGGGLTVIANAPNPVGFSLLGEHFGKDGIHPLYLFISALPFTVLAALIFWFL
jgi:hypothetical protein